MKEPDSANELVSRIPGVDSRQHSVVSAIATAITIMQQASKEQSADNGD